MVRVLKLKGFIELEIEEQIKLFEAIAANKNLKDLTLDYFSCQGEDNKMLEFIASHI